DWSPALPLDMTTTWTGLLVLAGLSPAGMAASLAAPDLAGLAHGDLLIGLVENLDLAPFDGKATRKGKFRVVSTVVRLAQDGDGITFRLTVKLREHRSDTFEALEQTARRNRRIAVEEQFERGEVGLGQRGIVQEHVNHCRHEQREVDPLPGDRGEDGFGIEAPDEVHRAAAH